jgi:hypothetical protein
MPRVKSLWEKDFCEFSAPKADSGTDIPEGLRIHIPAAIPSPEQNETGLTRK